VDLLQRTGLYKNKPRLYVIYTVHSSLNVSFFSHFMQTQNCCKLIVYALHFLNVDLHICVRSFTCMYAYAHMYISRYVCIYEHTYLGLYVCIESFIAKKLTIFWNETSEEKQKFDFMFTDVSYSCLFLWVSYCVCVYKVWYSILFHYLTFNKLFSFVTHSLFITNPEASAVLKKQTLVL
jgi:hypothetical protein